MDINKQNDKEVEKLEKKLRKVYLQAQADTQTKMEDYLQRFATKDAIKLEQVKQGKITQAQYLEWRKGQIAVGKQWQDKVDALAADYTNANKIAMGMVRNDMAGTFATNHNYAAYQLEHDTSLDLSFTLYDQYTLKNLVAKDPDLLPLPSVDIPKDSRWNKQKINSVITQAVLQGDSIPKIAQSLRRVTDMNHSAAVRNARTSMTAAQNAGRVESYKHAQDMGIDMQQEWLATLDGRTRHSHRQMDGERIAIAKDKWHPAKFSNGCRYPGDPQGPAWEIYNCRCTLVAAIKGIDQSDAPRNSKLGDMSYEEWKAGHTKKTTTTAPLPTTTPNVVGGYSEERRQNAHKFDNNTKADADRLLRPVAGQCWQNAPDSERDAAFRYTRNSDGFNLPLRGYKGSWQNFVGVDKVDLDSGGRGDYIKHLTNYIKKNKMPEDTWLVRSFKTADGMASFLQIPTNVLTDSTPEELTNLLANRVVRDEAFVSCSTAEGSKFSGFMQLRVFVPKGTQAAYLEPISRFGGANKNGNGRDWDGVSEARYLGEEFETLLQRGTSFRVLGVRSDSKYSPKYVEVEVIDQMK